MRYWFLFFHCRLCLLTCTRNPLGLNVREHGVSLAFETVKSTLASDILAASKDAKQTVADCMVTLRSGEYDFFKPVSHTVDWPPVHASELMCALMHGTASTRITIEQALQHPWFEGHAHKRELTGALSDDSFSTLADRCVQASNATLV